MAAQAQRSTERTFGLQGDRGRGADGGVQPARLPLCCYQLHERGAVAQALRTRHATLWVHMRGEAGGTSLLCDVCRQQQQQQQEQTPGAAVPFCSVHCTHRECNEVVALPSAGSNATICHNLDLAGAGDGKAVVLYRRDSHLQRRRGRAGGRAVAKIGGRLPQSSLAPCKQLLRSPRHPRVVEHQW